jgi:hypothetical protein
MAVSVELSGVTVLAMLRRKDQTKIRKQPLLPVIFAIKIPFSKYTGKHGPIETDG